MNGIQRGDGFIVRHCVPYRKGSLRAFVLIETPSGFRFWDVSIHKYRDTVWALPPKKERLGRDGRWIIDKGGRRLFHTVIDFANVEAKQRFSNAVIEAVKASFPEVLE